MEMNIAVCDDQPEVSRGAQNVTELRAKRN